MGYRQSAQGGRVTASIAALLQPMKDRLTAATPGPWFAVRFYVGAGSDQTDPHTEIAKASFKPDAEFIAAAPTDQAKLIAAIEAVVSLAVDDAPAGHHYLAALTQALGGDTA